jgi:hypothetical protein
MVGRRKVRWIVALAAALAVAAGVVAYVLTRGQTQMVELELRAKPVATIRMEGKHLGSTPKKIRLPKSAKPLAFEATFVVHKVNAMTGQKKNVIYKQTLTVTPDAPQSVDFDLDHATKQDDPNG